MYGTRGKLLDARCPVDFSHPLNRGLVAEWSVPPLSGWRRALTLRDLVRGGKKANDGTLVNAPAWQGATHVGGYGSLSFTAASSQLVYTALTPPTAGMALASWFKTTAASVTIAGWNNNNTASSGVDDRELFIDAAGHVVFYIFTGSSIEVPTTAAYNDGKWHHAVAVVGTQIDVYVDGVVAASPGVGTGGYNGYTTPFLIAAKGQHTAGYFDGPLDGVTVFNRALSAAEVMALYLESKRGNPERWRWLSRAVSAGPPAPAGPVASWLWSV